MIDLGPAKTEFSAVLEDGNAVTWRMDLVSAIEAIDLVRGQKSADPYADLHEAVKVVTDAGGPKLTMDQAQQFVNGIEIEYTRQKKTHRDTLDALVSLDSTGSTPSNLETANS